MPKVKISEFSSTPANNTDIDSINLAEGCAPSGINDAIRELMAQLKDFQTGAVGDSFNGPVGTTTAAAGAFTTLSSTGNTTLGDASGDSVTINGTATFANANPTLSAGTANGVAYLNGSKVVTSGSALTFDGTNLGVGVSSPNQLLDVRGANGIGIRFLETSTGNTNRVQLGTGSGFGYIDATAGSGSTALAFQVASSEQMRLTSTGLGIGTSSPSSKLDIVGITQWQATAGTVLGKLTYSGGEPTVLANTGLGLQFFTNNAFAAKIDSSGNFGIGTSSPSYKLDVAGVARSDSWIGRTNGSAPTADCAMYRPADNSLGFSTANTERARIDSSGNLLVNTTSTVGGSASKLQVVSTGSTEVVTIKATNSSGTRYMISFQNQSGTYVGSISQDGTNTTYGTSSDYRLKNTIAPMTGALAKVALLKPCTYKWNADGSDGQGFIAHELAEVVPQCVTGEKDAVDEEGNPKYQGIDTSFLVATLTAAIQELKAEFDAYKASHP